MSSIIYKADYITTCDGEKLREIIDSIKHGFIYDAQDMVDILEKENLLREGTDEDRFMIHDDTPSPVIYKGEKYECIDIWDEGEYLPLAFILMKIEENS